MKEQGKKNDIILFVAQIDLDQKGWKLSNLVKIHSSKVNKIACKIESCLNEDLLDVLLHF